MIYKIFDDQDQFFSYLKDDPVRPHIPYKHRLGNNRSVLIIEEQGYPIAITCVSFAAHVPESEQDLFEDTVNPVVAVFYTIWSYQTGAGRRLIFEAVEYIKHNFPTVSRFVTLSPKTEMAHKFHTKNGARVFRENFDTINYEYVT